MAPPLSMASSSLALARAEARKTPGDIVKYYSTRPLAAKGPGTLENLEWHA
jgi:hypothetical protein